MTKDEALALFGGNVSKLADALGVRPQAVRKWGKHVPPLRVYQIKEIIKEVSK